MGSLDLTHKRMATPIVDPAEYTSGPARIRLMTGTYPVMERVTVERALGIPGTNGADKTSYLVAIPEFFEPQACNYILRSKDSGAEFSLCRLEHFLGLVPDPEGGERESYVLSVDGDVAPGEYVLIPQS